MVQVLSMERDILTSLSFNISNQSCTYHHASLILKTALFAAGDPFKDDIENELNSYLLYLCYISTYSVRLSNTDITAAVVSLTLKNLHRYVTTYNKLHFLSDIARVRKEVELAKI